VLLRAAAMMSLSHVAAALLALGGLGVMLL